MKWVSYSNISIHRHCQTCVDIHCPRHVQNSGRVNSSHPENSTPYIIGEILDYFVRLFFPLWLTMSLQASLREKTIVLDPRSKISIADKPAKYMFSEEFLKKRCNEKTKFNFTAYASS